jgi:preprotein translocase subunit YajC
MLISILSDFIFIVAQDGGGEEETSGIAQYYSIIMIVLLVVVFYFLLIRPGQKQRRAHKELVTSVKKGDEVMTAGGFFGTVTKVQDEDIMIELNKKNIVKLSRSSIARIVSQEEEEYEEEELEEEYEEEAVDEDMGEEEE